MFIPASALLAMHSIYIRQLMRPAAAPLIVHMAICLGGVVIICDYLHPAICLGGDLPEHELYILISATMGQWRECLICFLRAFIFFSFFSIWLGVRAQFLSCHCSFSMHVWSSLQPSVAFIIFLCFFVTCLSKVDYFKFPAKTIVYFLRDWKVSTLPSNTF